MVTGSYENRRTALPGAKDGIVQDVGQRQLIRALIGLHGAAWVC